MSAVACLRVDVTAAKATMPEATLNALVRKLTSAYLETRWMWPRRFTPLTEVSFLLMDPRADELDVEELRKLSEELQHHLFGQGHDGEVALLVFEGGHEAVTQFAALDRATVIAGIDDPELLPAGGRLTRIVARPPVEVPLRSDPQGEACAPDMAPVTVRPKWVWEPQPPAPPAWEGVQGVYFLPRQIFFGDVATYIPVNGKVHLSTVDGAEHRPKDPAAFDAACMKITLRLLAERGKGTLIYVPVCFTSLVRPSLRGQYEAMFAELPLERRGELAVSIYDVPRDPVFTGLKQARALVEPYFSVVDLQVTDPGFEIEKLPAEAANSVTLALPDGDSFVRMSALRRFGERIPHYKQKRIWPGVTNVRRRVEVEAAERLHIPFLTGPAICSPVPAPVGGRTVGVEHLPMGLAGWMNVRDHEIGGPGPTASSPVRPAGRPGPPA